MQNYLNEVQGNEVSRRSQTGQADMAPNLTNAAKYTAAHELAQGNIRRSAGASLLGQAFDPQYDFRGWQGQMAQDPRIAATQGKMDYRQDQLGSSVSDFARGAQRYGQDARGFLSKDMGSLRGAAYGQGQSYADLWGAQQRQQAMGDIARQAAMGARGGMTAADRRNAIMQQSNVGANMASGIAAAREQERQQAMQTYLGAQQAQLGARQSGAAMLGDVAGRRGQAFDAAGQAYGQELQRFGGLAGLGHTSFSQRAGIFNPEYDLSSGGY